MIKFLKRFFNNKKCQWFHDWAEYTRKGRQLRVCFNCLKVQEYVSMHIPNGYGFYDVVYMWVDTKDK